MPVVICELEAGEKLISEAGAMAWMSPNMVMDTSMGGLGKAFGRMFSGESAFRNSFTATGGKGMIAFASHFPGNIRAVEITPDKPIIVQKCAFLAATEGVTVSVYFQKKMTTGFFGGEGFIMQKLSGTGLAFLEIDGSAVEYDLAVGEKLIVDTGYLAIASSSVQIDIQTVKGLKNKMFGGEGFFNTVLTGPGKVTLQTMPLMALTGGSSSGSSSDN